MPYQVTTADPRVNVDTDALERRVAALCKNQGVTTDAQWSTLVSTVFNGTNASGLTPLARTFLSEFFAQIVKIT